MNLRISNILNRCQDFLIYFIHADSLEAFLYFVNFRVICALFKHTEPQTTC